MFFINDDVKKLLSLTDLVLLDIKHINPEKCKDLVGASNKLELEFAKYLSDNNIFCEEFLKPDRRKYSVLLCM